MIRLLRSKAILLIIYSLSLTSCFVKPGGVDSRNSNSSGSSFDFKVNGGDEFTKSLQVNLELSFSSDKTEYVLANSQAACELSSAWQVISASISYELNNENSSNTLWMKSRNSSGVATSCISRTITHDNQEPSELVGLSWAKPAGGLSLTESLVLDWTSSSDNGPSGIDYIEGRVLRGHDQSELSTWMPINALASFSGLNLFSDKSYFVELRAVDKAGNKGRSVRTPNWSNRYLLSEGNIATNRVMSMFATDMDSDGRQDFIVINNRPSGPYEYMWMRIDTTGEIHLRKVFEDNYDIYVLKSGDFNGDGIVDIVYAENSSRGMFLLVGKGQSSYQKQQATTTKNTYIDTADIDGDGDLDIVGVSNTDSSLRVYYNNGQGVFTESLIASALGNSVFVKTTDLDQNSTMDILVASSIGDAIYLFTNDGSQNFIQTTLATFDGVTYVDVIDLDKDGDLDVFGASEGFGVLKWFSNNSDTTFTERAIATGLTNMQQPKLLDMNSDGEYDILLGNYLADVYRVLLNDGSENFSDEIIHNIDTPGSIFGMDVNNDTFVDFIGMVQYDPSPILGLNDNLFNFSVKPIYPTPINIASGDMNGDSYSDVLFVQYKDLKLNIAYNDTTGAFLEPQYSGVSFTSYINTLKVVDMEPDGDLDIVYGSTTEVGWVRNDGGGSFTKVIIASSLVSMNALDVFDIDKDGDMDLVYISSQNLILRVNDGLESFSSTTVQASFGSSTAIKIQDFDLDGNNDIIATSYSNDVLSWYKNNGALSFTRFDILSSFDSAYEFEVADLDGDTDNDVAVIAAGSVMYFIENLGGGTYDTHSLGTVAGTENFKVLDFDVDGDLDILVLNGTSDDLKVLENRSAGVFVMKQIMGGLTKPTNFCYDDFNNDTKVDLLVSLSSKSGFMVLQKD